MKTNKKAVDYRVDRDESKRLAGGYGPYPAKQSPEALLRRSVMACLLWEKQFYEDGKSVTGNIRELIPQVDPATVASIAIKARTAQKLRHVPLFIAREMARLPEHKALVGDLLPRIIRRADEMAEFLAIYWQDDKSQPIANQVKKGLAAAFDRFDAYQLAKWRGDGNAIKLRDVMFLTHPKPAQGKEELYRQVAENTLPTPDTWEVALSSGQNKKEAWTRLIQEGRLGAMAFLRNLRNMEQAGVEPAVIRQGFEQVRPTWLLPLNYLAAARAAPRFERDIEALMLRGLAEAPKLPGYTILVVDVSGSMNSPVSGKSRFSRLDAAASMAMLAAEMSEHAAIYITAGSDAARKHQTKLLPPRRGFALADDVKNGGFVVGSGGIFTRQCLEYIREQERETPDRIIVFSDSQDCDYPHLRVPAPFGHHNYIIDVSVHRNGVAYDGLWTAEVSGWSEHFLKYIAALEDENPSQ